MASPTKTITTAEQLLNAPPDLGRCELVRGELMMMSPGQRRHGTVCMRIGAALHGYVTTNNLGDVYDSSVGYVVGRSPDTVREPDVSFISTERLVGQDLDAFVEGAPDLAVEVLSPSNTDAEMRAKMDDYFRAGCRVVWIVDPQQRTVVIHRPNAAPVVLTENDTLTEEDLLPGFSAAVHEFFPKR